MSVRTGSRRAVLTGVVAVWSIAVAATTAAQDRSGLVERQRNRIAASEEEGHHEAALELYEQLHRTGNLDSALVHGFAHTLAVTGAHERVVELMRKRLAAAPTDAEAAIRLGRAQVELERQPEALAAWDQALAADPANARRYRQVSNLCAAAGMAAASIEVLERGREELGQPTLFSWELASLQLATRSYDRAVAEYLAHLRNNPQRYTAVENRLTTAAADSGRSSQLLAALRENRKPGSEPAEFGLLEAVCLLEAGDAEAGLRTLAASLSSPEEMALLFRYAGRCEEAGADAAAAAAYELFVEHVPAARLRYRALLQLATIHQRLGRHAAAAETYATLAAENPGRGEAEEALLALGRMQLEVLRDPERATQSLTAALVSSPRGPRAAAILALLAQCAVGRGDLDMAEAHMIQQLSLDPAAANAVRYGRAELLFFRGDFTAATEELTQLLASDPGHELANDALGLILLMESAADAEPVLGAFAQALLWQRQDRPEEAASHWQAVREYGSPDLRQRALLAKAGYYLASDPGQALALYEELVRDFPTGDHVVEAHVACARLYESGGRARAALKAYETALLAYPDHVHAATIRLQVDRLRRTNETDALRGRG